MKILKIILIIFNFYTILFLFWETKVKRIKQFLCLFLSVLEMECFKNIIHYESTIIISLPCIQLAKLKSCSVWCFSEKKIVGAWGIWPSPVGGPAPHTRYKNKSGKNQPFFGFLYFTPSPPPPHPTPTKNNLVPPLENLVLRLVKIFSGVKIHAIWRLVLRLVKYSLE